MKRLYTRYTLIGLPLGFILYSSSYNVLLLASIVGIAVLSISVFAWIGIFSASERVAHGAVRVWKAVVPLHMSRIIFRQ